jgi:indoleamine 2,3-dioxygenase
MINLPRGFLPDHDPLTQLPAIFSEWESIAVDLPKWLVSRYLRKIIEALPVFPAEKLSSPAEMERAMLILSYLGQAYVWADLQHPATSLPSSIAIPWHQVAAQLGRPPILSYASYALHNWRRLNPHQEIELGNIALLQNFLGGLDEEWFILVHVDIEAKAIPGLQAILPAFAAVTREDLNGLAQEMETIRQALTNMCATLNRMPEGCDPYIYYHRVRPYIHGWKNNPALPDGILYTGVAEYKNKPVKFKGETGAQSSIIPVMDAAFGISHADNPLKTHLLEMQDYMPEAHRQFLSSVINNNNIRDFVQKHRHEGNIRDLYNACLQLLHEFRAIHLRYAAQYIQKQNQSSSGNPTDVGTGGTPFMEYLRQHREETQKKLI